METTKRRAKFGGLKVGDEVIIQSGHYRRIERVTRINPVRRTFSIDHKNYWPESYRLSDGIGTSRGSWNCTAIIGTVEEFQAIRDEKEHAELSQTFAAECPHCEGDDKPPWNRLTLDQLRTISGWLEQAVAPK